MARPGKKLDRLNDSNHIGSMSETLPSLPYDEIVQNYIKDTPLEHRKKYGQFFTPPSIAELMMNWILEISPKSILDPAVGPGIFVAEYLKRQRKDQFTAIDLDKNVIEYAKSIIESQSIYFIEDDFLKFNADTKFDAVISNPPYLRHHDFHYESDIFSEIGTKNNVRLSKLTNIYGLFVLEICRRLNFGGRASIIIPTEWTNSNFGTEIKRFLIENSLLSTFIYFSHEALPFDDALTTACVLLIEKKDPEYPREFINTLYLNAEVPLDDVWKIVQGNIDNVPGVIKKTIPSSILIHSKKWDFLLQNDYLEPIPGLVPLKVLAKTRRGIATGANEFFHLSEDRAQNIGIQNLHLSPCIGKAADVNGLIFDTEDFKKLKHNKKRTHLINITSEPNATESTYLKSGEADKLPERYLMTARKRWFDMERRPAAPIWAAVFGRAGLRFVRNRAAVLNLTTFHCIYPTDDSAIFCDALTVCLNSRLVQDRARQQHRVYGGGLLKMEPKDLLDIEVPDLSAIDNASLAGLAELLNELDAANRAETEISEQLLFRIDAAVSAAIDMAATKHRAHSVQNDLFESCNI